MRVSSGKYSVDTRTGVYKRRICVALFVVLFKIYFTMCSVAKWFVFRVAATTQSVCSLQNTLFPFFVNHLKFTFDDVGPGRDFRDTNQIFIFIYNFIF